MNAGAQLQLEILLALAEGLAMTGLKVALQGGACLHMCHHSPRFSEGLNFLVAGALAKLDPLMPAVARTVSAKLLARGYNQVRLAGQGGESRSERRRLYQLVMPGASVVTRVIVGFIGVPAPDLDRYAIEMRTPRLDGLATSVMAELPVGSLEAIEADAVVTLAMRQVPKAGDVFDLGWIGHQRAGLPLSLDALQTTCALYNDAPDIRTILNLAHVRLGAFTPVDISEELRKFLPTGLTPAYAESLQNEARRTLNRYQKLLEHWENAHGERP